MKWYSKNKILRKYRWHEWFAWYPIKIEHARGLNELIWLEKVWRRGDRAYKGKQSNDRLR